MGAVEEQCAAQERPFRAVALAAGLPSDLIHDLLTGKADLRLGEMAAISNVLNVRASEIIAQAEAKGWQGP
jgi:hypothetical protein